ncbi:MAG TPA: hypothetical protein VE444_10755 [Gaiellaceae bacterium]|nr:hypothetical protein [Gaiellaceae bacterium]
MRLVVAAAAAALALAGCADAPETVAAEDAVSREAGTDRVDCTGRSRIWFREGEPARVVICVAHREHGLCDKYRVDLGEQETTVATLSRGSDCALPPG